jgi:predicted DNA-binding transcriptional regulator AlpA
MVGVAERQFDPLPSPNEVGALAGVTAATIRNWARKRMMPEPLRLGGILRFRLHEIEAWLGLRTAATGEGVTSVSA